MHRFARGSRLGDDAPLAGITGIKTVDLFTNPVFLGGRDDERNLDHAAIVSATVIAAGTAAFVTLTGERNRQFKTAALPSAAGLCRLPRAPAANRQTQRNDKKNELAHPGKTHRSTPCNFISATENNREPSFGCGCTRYAGFFAT
jgi:hypothetical protein